MMINYEPTAPTRVRPSRFEGGKGLPRRILQPVLFRPGDASLGTLDEMKLVSGKSHHYSTRSTKTHVCLCLGDVLGKER